MSYPGTYHITDTSEWGEDFVHARNQAFLIVNKDLDGEFQIGAIRGQFQSEMDIYKGVERLEFTWEGENAGKEVHGGGWVALKEALDLEGIIRIHKGDSTGFTAKRIS